jgi:hypothetical protein
VELSPEAVPVIAVEALERGCTSQAVAVLAGASGRIGRSIEDLLPPVLSELGLRRPSDDEAFKIVVDHLAREIADGRIEPGGAARADVRRSR